MGFSARFRDGIEALFAGFHGGLELVNGLFLCRFSGMSFRLVLDYFCADFRVLGGWFSW